jgi:dTDP-4-dehydrorhamnose 3,5-epimerase
MLAEVKAPACKQFHQAPIAGVVWRPLGRYSDGRGWRVELFRADECLDGFFPAMAYVSETPPGVARGPREHTEQTNYFCFPGPSRFKVYLWDNRPDSPTFGAHLAEVVGEGRPMALQIPPGVVHAYENVGDRPGLVWNCPDRLVRGYGRREPADEIRHEDDSTSPFRLHGEK